MSYKYFYHTNSKEAVLAHSHYSDPAFDGDGAVIFGKKKDGLRWEYADRLQQWERDKSNSAFDRAKEEHGNKNTARRTERYLQLYFEDDSIELVCIISGTQPFNGYPWHVYGFKQAEAKAAIDAAK